MSLYSVPYLSFLCIIEEHSNTIPLKEVVVILIAVILCIATIYTNSLYYKKIGAEGLEECIVDYYNTIKQKEYETSINLYHSKTRYTKYTQKGGPPD